MKFVSEDEFESKVLSKPTEAPKFNHWVHTTLNQLVNQFEPFSISPFVLNWKKILKSAFFFCL